VESSTCRKELIIEVPPEVVERESDQVTAQYTRLARIPGFRPGHAPRTLVGKRYRDEIRNEVVQTLVPRYFEDKVRDEKLLVVGEPRFEDLKFEEGQPLSVKATFEIYPEIELKDYKGLEAEQEPGEVTDADVDEALERLRQQAASFEVVEGRGAEDDDYAMVNYRGQDLQDPKAEPVEAREGLVHLSGQGTVAAFAENLRGSRPGEVREFDVTYPEDFPGKRLSGRSIHYRVEVQGIKKKVVPRADDELAKTVSEFSTLEALRTHLRESLARNKQRHAENGAKRKLLDRLIDLHRFPVPETLVDEQLKRKVQRLATGLLAQGIDPRTADIDWHGMRGEMRAEAERDVQGSLILEKVAQAEGIEVSEEEVGNAGGSEDPLDTRGWPR
jgi:trigger factor